MKNILNFRLFEATLSSHFSGRFEERILNLEKVSIDSSESEEIEKKIKDQIGPKWKVHLLDAISKNTERRILENVKSISFSKDLNVGVPVSFLYLDFEGKTYPIKISSSSKNKKGETSIYEGSQIWVSVSGDIAWTIKIFDKNKSRESIYSNLKSGTSERYKKFPFKIGNFPDDFSVKFRWNPKTQFFDSNDKKEEKNSVDRKTIVPERKILSKGDRIGLIIKGISPDIITLGKILEITNINEIKDKQKTGSLSDIAGIKLSFLPIEKEKKVISNGKEIPFVSTLKSGSIIEIDEIEYLILGPEEGKPLITSEPSIIKSGKVQTWVQRITSS